MLGLSKGIMFEKIGLNVEIANQVFIIFFQPFPLPPDIAVFFKCALE